MTHVLRAHGLFATAIEAVGRMQVNLVDDLREMDPADIALGFQQPVLEDLQEVHVLCNKLDRDLCLGNADRELLRECVIARKAALNVIHSHWQVSPDALAQRVMDECDKILELTK